ncbi:peptidase [Marivita sp. GX14005]|uniref:peptidase n=1 Tax=Marivita sp. GX14005 TaxID=2942276 RepID=UPI0020194F6C|nr:peptidase [Marivita sp. GX14005]
MTLVVKAARGWIGTPYVHQASLRGVGADCLGLIRGIWRELHGCEPGAVPAYSADWSEAGGEERLWRGLAARMDARDLHGEAAGDLLLFRMREGAVAKHLGIQARIGPEASFVHAYSGRGVLETSLSAPWRRRIVARFAFSDKG